MGFRKLSWNTTKMVLKAAQSVDPQTAAAVTSKAIETGKAVAKTIKTTEAGRNAVAAASSAANAISNKAATALGKTDTRKLSEAVSGAAGSISKAVSGATGNISRAAGSVSEAAHNVSTAAKTITEAAQSLDAKQMESLVKTAIDYSTNRRSGTSR